MVAIRSDWRDDARDRVHRIGVGDRRAAARSWRTRAQSPIDADAYEALRVEAGVPRQGLDIDETTIAQEAFLERDAVSFTKGCFLGQELVCRIDSRGHVNRLLRRLRSDAALERGAVVVADGKDVGAVTSCGRRTSALAMLRREVEPGSEVVVRVAAGDVERAGRGGRAVVAGSLTHAFNERAPLRATEAVGSVTTKRVPPPGGASTDAIPPIAAASSRTIARPRPVPTDRPGVVADV